MLPAERPQPGKTGNRDFITLNRQVVKCERCPRLIAHSRQVAVTKRRAYLDWNYWGKPVPSFGDISARLLILGLAPGAHGANRTGRVFTGDRSGDFLYKSAGGNQLLNQTLEESVMRKTMLGILCACAGLLLAQSGSHQNAFTPDQIKYGPPPPFVASGAGA